MDVASCKQELADAILLSALDHHVKVWLMQLGSVVDSLVAVVAQVGSDVEQLHVTKVSLRLCLLLLLLWLWRWLLLLRLLGGLL